MSNNLKSNIFGVFNRLSDYRRKGLFCDVKLSIGEHVYPCHRNILAAKCPYFEKMFTGEFAESESDVVALHHIDVSSFEEILEYIYTHRLKINKENAFTMLKQSNYLNLEDMEKKCKNYIVDTSNSVFYVLEICEFAHLMKDTEFLEKLTKVVAANFKKQSKSEQFLNLSFEVLRSILRWLPCYEESEGSSDAIESEKLATILEWIKKDAGKRTGYLEELLEFVSLPRDFHGVLTNTFVDHISNVVLTDSVTLNVFCATSSKKDTTPDISMITLRNDCWNWRKDVCKETLSFRSVAVDEQMYHLSYTVQDGKHSNQFFKEKFDENELLRPPVLVSSYSLATIRGTMFLYNSSENFVPLDKAASWTNLSNEELSQNSIFAYNIDLNKWFSVPSVPELLYNSYMVTSGNQLYLIGGSKEFELSKGSRRNIVQMYDSRSPKWTKLKMTASDVQFSLNGAAVAYDDKLFICESSNNPDGVNTNITRYANTLNFLDVRSQDWRKNGIDFEVPLPHVFVPYKNKLWLFGYDVDLKGAIYNPKANNWTKMCPLPKKIQTSYGESKLCRILDAVVC